MFWQEAKLNSDLIKQLFRSFVGKDNDSFLKAANEIIKNEERKKHRVLVKELKEILNNNGDIDIPSEGYQKRFKENIPIPRDGDKGFPLLEIKEFHLDWSDVILAHNIVAALNRVLQEYDKSEILATYGIKPKQKLSRRIASRAFNILVKFLFSLKVNDTQCGAKIFKKEPLKEVLPSLGITKWAFDVDLLYQLKRRGKKILEIPTEWHDKKGSNLKLGKTVPEMFLGIVRLRLLYSPLNFTVKMYDRLPESVKIHHRWR